MEKIVLKKMDKVTQGIDVGQFSNLPDMYTEFHKIRSCRIGGIVTNRQTTDWQQIPQHEKFMYCIMGYHNYTNKRLHDYLPVNVNKYLY